MDLPASRRHDSYAALRIPEIRLLLGAAACAGLANRALAAVIAYQIYVLTDNALSLALLGLVEAIPAIATALFGGYIADRHDRRTILLITRTSSLLCALAFAIISLDGKDTSIVALLAIVFVAGIASGFHAPAGHAFEAQVVPQHLTLNASSWASIAWQGTSIIGPAVGGIAYAAVGPVWAYVGMAVLHVAALLCTAAIARKPKPVPIPGESMVKNVSIGLRYVFGNQILIGAMALDLFAVLFGGAVALIPVFAKDILKVGPQAVGFLYAAPAVGALLIMLWTTRFPPVRRAGRNLMLCIAGFGVSIIVFAFSEALWLSLLALAIAGAFDGISVVIRRAILRLHSPDHMRGRIAAVNMMCISASNELGAFESGVAAAAIGAVPAVWVGSIVTLVIVGATAALAPKLRDLDLQDAVRQPVQPPPPEKPKPA